MNIMSKTYTLEDGESLMAELKSTRGMMAEMRGRLERDEITPDEWREWYAGYQARLDEIKEAVSGMREEVSRRNADLERQKRERAAELNMSLEEYEEFFDYINDVLTRLMKGETDYKSLIPCRSSSACLLPRGHKNYKPLPKDDGEGQKEVA